MLILQCQSIDFTNSFAQADIPSGEPVLIELPRDFKIDGGQGDVILRLKKNIYGQDKASYLCYESLRNGLLERGFVMGKEDPCLFIYDTVICVVYVDDCLLWKSSQYDIDNVTKSFKEDGSSYNWEHSKVESVSEFWGIDINTWDDGGFHFFQTGFIRKVLESTVMQHGNRFPLPTKVEVPLSTYTIGSEAKRDLPNSFDFVIGMILYLASSTRPDISFMDD